MNINFASGVVISCKLYDNPLATFYTKAIKHLQHAVLPFYLQDNPYYFELDPEQKIFNILNNAASLLGIEVVRDNLSNQHYLNNLHLIYEKNYDGDPVWLKFHEAIHLYEHLNKDKCIKTKFVTIDYRESAGPLTKRFDNRYLEYGTSILSKGEMFLSWAELGKWPYEYWKDSEPDNIQRMIELAKPWCLLRPKIQISLIDTDLCDIEDLDKFSTWFEQYKEAWCNHWKINNWNNRNMFTVIPIGKIMDFDQFIAQLKKEDKISKVSL